MDSGAIKTPASKLAFLQTHSEDRQVLGDSMLFSDIENKDIARMTPGWAYFYTEGYHYPIKIQTINLHQSLDLSLLPDVSLSSIIRGEKWFREAHFQRLKEQIDRIKDVLDQYDDKKGSVNLAVQRLMKLRDKCVVSKNNDGLTLIIRSLRSEKRKLDAAYHSLLNFIRKHRFEWKELKKISDALLSEYAQKTHKRFEGVTRPDTEKLYLFIANVIKNCQTSKLKGKSNGTTFRRTNSP